MQFPLMLAFAVTIHKSQRMTVDRIRIALGKGEPNIGVAFVALSRVRRVEDLLIDYRDFTLARLTGIVLPAISAAYDVQTDRLNRESMRLVSDDE
jgi:ATP-dependent exoDNAse (exonuclease V) alpha subunit